MKIANKQLIILINQKMKIFVMTIVLSPKIILLRPRTLIIRMKIYVPINVKEQIYIMVKIKFVDLIVMPLVKLI